MERFADEILKYDEMGKLRGSANSPDNRTKPM